MNNPIERVLRLTTRLLLLSVLVGLSIGVYVGLQRMGWVLPTLYPASVSTHGALMIGGVLATLISLERAIALMAVQGSVWPISVPVIGALGTLLLLSVPDSTLPRWLLWWASLGFVVLNGLIIWRQRTLFTWLLGLAAVTLAVGNGLWLAGYAQFDAVWWWLAFLVLTIVAERLELARILKPSALKQPSLMAVVGVILLGLVVSLAQRALGVRLLGLGHLGLALWLMYYDIAKVTVRKHGLTRFIAVALLLGYGWLLISGVLMLLYGGELAGLAYDSMLHSITLGFVFSMVFAHAPVIIPAVAGLTIYYTPRFYWHLALLHLSTALRVIGDVTLNMEWRQWGGMLNMLALLLFLVNTVLASRFVSPPAKRQA